MKDYRPATALDFTGKTVLVTGGGAGIGRAIVDAFAAAGASLFIAEIDETRAEEVAQAYPNAVVIPCDICARETPAFLAERIGKEAGKLDVLVNNVGHFVHARPFADLADEQIDEILDVNLGQLLRTTRAMVPLLREAAPGSSIVNITSIEAYRGIPYCTVYAAGKAAIAGFTKALSLELAPLGIRVNDVAPETTDTPQVPINMMIPPENRANMDKWIPLGRFGRPSDCANAALYLASPLAAWVTGTAIHVDGGALAASGWMQTPTGEWTVVPMVTGNGIKIPGAA